MKSLIKILKHPALLVTVTLFLTAVAVAIGYYHESPANEITPKQLSFLVQKKLIARASIAPLPYTGIYHIEGVFGKDAAAKGAAFTITAHLEQSQHDSLLAQRDV